MANFPNPPNIRTPFLDDQGQISRDWYLWLQSVTKAFNDLLARVTALEP